MAGRPEIDRAGLGSEGQPRRSLGCGRGWLVVGRPPPVGVVRPICGHAGTHVAGAAELHEADDFPSALERLRAPQLLRHRRAKRQRSRKQENEGAEHHFFSSLTRWSLM